MNDIMKHSEYRQWLSDLKQQIKVIQIKAAISVNSQLIMFYWDLGKQITEKQEKAKWGSKFIEQLSKDLREEFPEMTGFSATNLNYCKRFFKFYSIFENENKTLIKNFPQVGGNLQNIDYKENINHPQVGGELKISKIVFNIEYDEFKTK